MMREKEKRNNNERHEVENQRKDSPVFFEDPIVLNLPENVG